MKDIIPQQVNGKQYYTGPQVEKILIAEGLTDSKWTVRFWMRELEQIKIGSSVLIPVEEIPTFIRMKKGGDSK